jgi:prevent-host-death family protein
MKAKKLKAENLPTSTEIKTHFGEYIMKSQKEPVVFQKNNKKAGVLISYEQFQKYQELEDSYWFDRAKSETEMLGNKASKAILDEL